MSIMSYDREVQKRNFVKKYQGTPVLSLNHDKIIQVLINLIRNAVHATTDRGTITVAITENQQYVVVDVSDDGCGIPPKHQELIWQPFFTTKGEYGTGLGLDICKRIIEGHHGRIFCQSEVGVGTTFTIQFPHESVREQGSRETGAVDKAVA
jgi:signal transduction histidine kinase